MGTSARVTLVWLLFSIPATAAALLLAVTVLAVSACGDDGAQAPPTSVATATPLPTSAVVFFSSPTAIIASAALTTAGRIAFHSDRDGNQEIYVMDADGSNQTRLTNNGAEDSEPVWSPNGSKIAFMSDRDGNFEIYVMNADGSNQTRLTNDHGQEKLPRWSPDGSKIVFMSARNVDYEIYVMNADGSNQINVTNSPGDDVAHDWSSGVVR